MPLLLYLLCVLWTPALAAQGDTLETSCEPIRRFYRTDKPECLEYG